MMKKAVSCALVCATVFLSVVVFASCSSSGGDSNKAINPLSPTEQSAQMAVLEVNDTVLQEINDSLESTPVGSGRAAVSESYSGTVYDDTLTGSVAYSGTASYDDATKKSTFSGTYTFDNFTVTGEDGKVYVIDGSETVSYSVTSTVSTSDTATTTVMDISESDVGDLDVSIDGTAVSLNFDYDVDYLYTMTMTVTETGFSIHYSIDGAVDGTFNGQKVYQPLDQEGDYALDM